MFHREDTVANNGRIPYDHDEEDKHVNELLDDDDDEDDDDEEDDDIDNMLDGEKR